VCACVWGGKVKSITGVFEEPGGIVSETACVQCLYRTVGVLSALNNNNNEGWEH